MYIKKLETLSSFKVLKFNQSCIKIKIMRSFKIIFAGVCIGLFSLPSASDEFKEFKYLFTVGEEPVELILKKEEPLELILKKEEPKKEPKAATKEEPKEKPKAVAREKSKDFYIKFGGGKGFSSAVTGDITDSGTLYEGSFETKNPGVISIGLGKEFNDYRIQFEYTASTIESDKVTAESEGVAVTASMTPNIKADTSSYMIYGLKEFNNDSKFTSYAGIGLGIGSLSLNDQTITLAGTALSLKASDEPVFSFALRGGTEYEMSENIFIYSEATYQNFAPFKFEEPGFATVNFDSNHLFALTAGLKFNF